MCVGGTPLSQNNPAELLPLHAATRLWLHTAHLPTQATAVCAVLWRPCCAVLCRAGKKTVVARFVYVLFLFFLAFFFLSFLKCPVVVVLETRCVLCVEWLGWTMFTSRDGCVVPRVGHTTLTQQRPHNNGGAVGYQFTLPYVLLFAYHYCPDMDLCIYRSTCPELCCL